MIRFDVKDPIIRKKISEALKGNKHRLGKPSWNKGKKMSEEFRKKISDSLQGKKGPLARNWKGGLKKTRVRIRDGKSIGRLKVRLLVLNRDGFKCQYCGRGKDETVLEIDHFIPRAQGGESKIDNYLTACRDCNRGKGDIILGENIES